MAIPTDADRSAYEMIGGAYDKLSEIHPFADEFFKIFEEGGDPLGPGSKFSSALGKAGNAIKVVDVYKAAKLGLDEYGRQGEFQLTVMIKVGTELAGKVLGRSIETHPYFQLQKPGLELLGKVLTATAKHEDAVANYRKAVTAANASQLSDEFRKLDDRRSKMSAVRREFVDKWRIAHQVLNGGGSPEYLAKMVKAAGAENLKSSIYHLQNWREMWAGLAFDAMQLAIMVGVQLKAARAAMAKVNKLIAELTAGDAASRVAGYGAMNKIEWAKYEGIVGKKQSAQMFMDPVAYAEGKLAKALEWAQLLADANDFMRTSDILWEKKYDDWLGKLMNGMRIY